MIETTNIVKVLGDRYILRGVNLNINQGESVALLGPNGAGKSTWLKIVAGLLKPSQGEVYLHGTPFKTDDFERQQQIGYLGHKSFLYEALSPRENLRFFAKLYNLEHPESRIDQLIEAVGLSFFQNEPVHTFSRGMLQRLAIARTLLQKPTTLLLDEPYTGLDQQAIQMLNKLLEQLRQSDTTMVIVTHDFEHITDVCNRVVLLDKGKIIADESLQDRSVAWVKQLYSGELQ